MTFMSVTIRADLSKLKAMLSRGFRATSVQVTFNPDPANPGAVRPHAVVSVENGKDVLELESDDFDFSMYSLSLHAARDQAVRGNSGRSPTRTDIGKKWSNFAVMPTASGWPLSSG